MRIIVAGLLLLALSADINAAPIELTFSGTGTVSVGGVQYTDRDWEIVLLADSDNAQPHPYLWDANFLLYIAPYATGTISIEGIGSGDLTSSYLPYFTGGDEAGVGLTTDLDGTYFPIAGSITGPSALSCSGEWVYGGLGEPDIWQDDCFKFDQNVASIAFAFGGDNTAMGSTLGNIQISSTTGVFSAALVPIPAAVWLFGSALAGLGWIRRKQTA